MGLLARERKLLAQSRELKALREEVEKLREQNERMRAGMRRCTTCEYRIEWVQRRGEEPKATATDS